MLGCPACKHDTFIFGRLTTGKFIGDTLVLTEHLHYSAVKILINPKVVEERGRILDEHQRCSNCLLRMIQKQLHSSGSLREYERDQSMFDLKSEQ